MKSFFLKSLFVCLSFCLLSQADIIAQEIVIKGKVLDKHTEEPIPFANVFLQGTTVGVSSDFDGLFELRTERIADTIGVSALGYTSMFSYLEDKPEQTLYFKLDRTAFELEEIVVRAGENPADILLRKIIKNKGQNDVSRLDYYQYETYNKLELDLKDLSDKFMNRKVFKPFSFIFENIDSVSEKDPFLPVFITETISDYHYQKNPEEVKEIIKASKISGIKNESVTQFLGNMYQKIDIYSNWMEIMGKNFVSPISDNGFNYYEYYLIDSNFIDSKWCYQINFKPKRKQINAFIGDFWVNDTTFAVKTITMTLQSDEVNINFVDQASAFQEFEMVSDSLWMLKKDKLIIDFVKTEKSPGFIGRKSTYFKDFLINDPKTEETFQIKEDLVVRDDVMDKSQEYWNENRHEELSKNEEAIYAMVDTIKNIPIAKTYADVITFVVTGYKDFGPIGIGPIFSLWSSNAVEDNRLQLGFKTNSKFSEKILLKGYGAYGFGDKDFKYGGSARFLLNTKPWQTLEVEYSNDLDVHGASAEEFGENNFLAGLYRRNVPQKLTRIRNSRMTYEREWRPGWSNKVSFVNRKLSPYFNFFYISDASGQNLKLDSIVTSSELKFSTRFAYREKFIEGKYSRASLGSDWPIVTLTYSLGLRGILGSDFNYHRFDVSIYDWFHVPPIGWSAFTLKAGKIVGDLPFLLLHQAPGNETFFYNTYSFNSMNEYEFISDTWATIFYTHHFDGVIFNRIPLLRKLRLRALVGFKGTWGFLTKDNIDKNSSPENFAGMWDEWNITAPKPFAEVSVGIENIFTLFRVDLVKRLSYLDNRDIPEYGIRAGMQVMF